MRKYKEGFFDRMKNSDKKGLEVSMFAISIFITIAAIVGVIVLTMVWMKSKEGTITDEEANASSVTESAVTEHDIEPTSEPSGNAVENEDIEDDSDLDPDLEEGGTGYVTSNVNMRDEASLTSSVVCKIQRGTLISIEEISKDKKWIKIEYNGKLGYISSMYVSASKPEALATAAPTTPPNATNPPSTKKPKTTAKPKVKKTPKPDPEEEDDPVDPIPTKKPTKVTQPPTITEKPKATEAPAPTDKPDPTDKPEPTDKPDPTPES